MWFSTKALLNSYTMLGYVEEFLGLGFSYEVIQLGLCEGERDFN